jgi:hypothetical protein
VPNLRLRTGIAHIARINRWFGVIMLCFDDEDLPPMSTFPFWM